MGTKRGLGWRARKGPQESNTTGFRALGHRLLLLPDETEEKTESGLILTKKTVDQDRNAHCYATVIEIGFDAWNDKSTDFCDVGDRVLIGQYTGKFHESPVDGKVYRFLTDLDVVSVVESVK
jgi:co-chaperonin GroES (HSP10)